MPLSPQPQQVEMYDTSGVESHPDTYAPISDYAIIGDCRTAALVSRAGSIDWLCLPHFSSPSVFAALLDRQQGGRFAIRPNAPYKSQRKYLEHTNVLQTTFTTDSGVIRVTDCLTIPNSRQNDNVLHPQREVLRIVECLSGEVEVEIIFEPRPDYAQRKPRLMRRGALGWACELGDEALMLHSDITLEHRDQDTAYGTVKITKGEKYFLSLTYVKHDIGIIVPLGDHAEHRSDDTAQWWREWCLLSKYDGPYKEAVERSALTLKLLTYGLSGALVAAPTTSLPSVIGGVRNWDYRFCWLRDAALTLSGFLELGYVGEGDAFLGWLLHTTRLTWPKLQVLYDVYGEMNLSEGELKHFEGYRDSKPVRIGNQASEQLQLDVYGEVIAAAYDYVRQGGILSPDEKRLLSGFGGVVCDDWRLTDQGIWEDRDEGHHHTHSKLMCWVALDRLVRMHEGQHLKVAVQRVARERDLIRDSIEKDGFSEKHGTYVTRYGGDVVDTSLMLMAIYGYKPADDPRLLATFERIDRELNENGFLYRFPKGFDDFLPPGEGAFIICSFWAVEYLARLGRRDEAYQRFEHILRSANDVGLLAEEVEAKTGEARGNFPQAFSHVGLINAALSLSRLERGGIEAARKVE
ncbi:MAG: glycoside hydrolase family 15 protein [Gammaproteobacteria bacterium]|jgi:GH15 family glucan-1,4-alpha-glucosidase